MTAPTVLLAANYDSQVGYAWHNIFRLFVYLARGLRQHGLEVCVSFPRSGPPVSGLTPEDSVRVLHFDPRLPGGMAATGRMFREAGIRFLYLTDQAFVRWQYALFRTWGVRRIVIHNRVSVVEPTRPARERGLRRLVRAVGTRAPWVTADRVYAVSDFVRHRLVECNCLPPAKVRVILNGIDVERWTCPEVSSRSSHVTFFTAARAASYKGLPTLIEAASVLRHKHAVEDFTVRYAGDGPDIQVFRQLVESHRVGKHFVFLGRIEDTHREVCAADIVVVPSAYGDACPSTVSEALASGRPLIATRAGGIPELVGDDGNAVLVSPRDARELADAMALLIAEPQRRAALGQAGRSRAVAVLREDTYHSRVLVALLEDYGLID